MRKIIVQEMLTVDGYFSGINGDISWHVVDAEFNKYAAGVLDTVDTLLFGRVTYDLMASYWPTPDALRDDPVIAKRMNNLHKIVFSKSADSVEWNNSTVLHDLNVTQISKLKHAEGKDIIIFGSGIVVSELANLDQIDEYRLIINPVILAKGRPLFLGLANMKKLELIETKVFSSGNVLLHYKSL